MLPNILQQKLNQSKMVVEEAFEQYPSERILVAWSGGKDSTLLLRLVLDICQQNNLRPPRALDIEENDQFPELTAFRDQLIHSWGLEILTVRNDDVLDRVKNIGDMIQVDQLNEANRTALRDIGYTASSLAWIPDSPVCNHLLKTLPVNTAIKQYDIAMLFTGIRWDEHGSRTGETYFSTRDNPPHTRGQPILHMTERDIWDITFALGIPYCSLYSDGYRSLGTKSATTRPSTIPAWKQDLESTTERGGRSEEKEKMMAQLRAWGYM